MNLHFIGGKKLITKKLSELANSITQQVRFGLKVPKIKFYSEKTLVAMQNLVQNYALGGKIAYVCTMDSTLKHCTDYARTIKGAGASMSTVVVSEFDLTIENLSSLFVLPDDVRMVMVSDVELIDFALYYASLKSLPVVVIPDTPSFNGILKTKISVLVGDKIDKITANVDRHVILSGSLEPCQIADVYAFIMSKLVALIDCRINRAVFKSTINKKAFDLIKQSVLSTFNILSVSEDRRKDVLIYNALAIELASMLSKGNITETSSESQATFLSGKKSSGIVSLIFAVQILKIYLQAINSNADFSSICDLNAIAEFMQEKTDVSSTLYLTNLTAQIKAIDKDSDNIKNTFLSLKDEVLSFVNLSDRILSTYTKLGGDIPKIPDYTSSLLHSGDTLEGANGMTLVREMNLIKTN